MMLDVAWLLFTVAVITNLGLIVAVAVITYTFRNLQKRYASLAYKYISLAASISSCAIIQTPDETKTTIDGPARH